MMAADGKMGDYDGDLAGLPLKEQQRITKRRANRDAAMAAYYKGAVTLSGIIGTVGVVGHFVMNRHVPSYRRLYYGVKTFLVSSSFACGWWIGGENAFQDWHRAHFNEMALQKRQAVTYMREKRAREQLGMDVGPAQAVEDAKADASA